MSIRSLDTETTGLDLHHGAAPYYVSTCVGGGRPEHWRWYIDPLTRRVEAPADELEEVRRLVLDAEELVGQNVKFDAHALSVLIPSLADEWPWERTHDTMVAAHLLASNRPKDLTSLATQYLGVDIQPFDDAMEEACKKARNMCRSHAALKGWAYAKEGRRDMPSAGKETWKYDSWLPAQVARRLWDVSEAKKAVDAVQPGVGYWVRVVTAAKGKVGAEWRPPGVLTPDEPGHSWYSVTEAYADTDAAVTVALWPVMRRLLRDRGLWDIYRSRMKLIPTVFRMERRGVTVSRARLEEMLGEYTTRGEAAGLECVDIARSYSVMKSYRELAIESGLDAGAPWNAVADKLTDDGRHLEGAAVELLFRTAERTGKDADEDTPVLPPYRLELAKGGAVNNSMRTLCFDLWKLPHVRNPKAKTDSPTLDSKSAIPHYLNTLPQGSREHRFFECLQERRGRGTAVGYLLAYRRFWVPLNGFACPRCDGRGTYAAPGGGRRCAVCDGTGYLDEHGEPVLWFVLHPNFKPTGTDTLRFGCENPNAQNISKREGLNVRQSFGPTPGREWWSLDAKNIELRIPAYESGERTLIDLFEKPDEPPFYGSNHLANFSAVYPDLWAEAVNEVGLERAGPHCKKKYASTWYQWCKNGGFAIQYGAVDRPGGGGTADVAFHKIGAHALLKSRFAKLEALNRKWIVFANKHGYVETIPDRSVDPRRGYPLLCTRTEYGKILETVPLSYHIQGTAMQWTCRAMDRVDSRLQEWNRRGGFDGFMTIQVHDELVLDFPRRGDPVKDAAYEKANGRLPLLRTSNLWRVREIQRLMSRGGDDIGVPTPVGCELHLDHWGEGVSI